MLHYKRRIDIFWCILFPLCKTKLYQLNKFNTILLRYVHITRCILLQIGLCSHDFWVNRDINCASKINCIRWWEYQNLKVLKSTLMCAFSLHVLYYRTRCVFNLYFDRFGCPIDQMCLFCMWKKRVKMLKLFITISNAIELPSSERPSIVIHLVTKPVHH